VKLQDYIQRGQVKKSSPDISLSKSLVKTAKNDLEFLDSLRISPISARKIMSNYYDVLRSILEAISALDGYKIYSHEAFTYFLAEKGENLISKKFDRFRKIRNQINYYGKDISVEEVKENIKEVKGLIDELSTKYLKK